MLIAFIDLDGFKQINDIHGHEAGDRLLTTMARQLGSALRSGDMLARMGGDEFVAVGMGPIPGEETVEGAVRRFGRRLFEHSVLQLPLSSRVMHYPGASVGVVAVDPAHTSVDEALRQADARMYEVKRQRRALG
ncbi:putative diguanylate cyclase YeaP [compost metagenome]